MTSSSSCSRSPSPLASIRPTSKPWNGYENDDDLWQLTLNPQGQQHRRGRAIGAWRLRTGARRVSNSSESRVCFLRHKRLPPADRVRLDDREE
jgi:hypothetical protein